MANTETVLETIGGMATQYQRLQKTKNNPTAELKAETIYGAIEKFISDTAPHGSGFNCGTRLVSITPQKLVLVTDYHHMNDGGFYDGWTHHKIIITAKFDGYDMRITGRDKRQIKQYIGDVFANWLENQMTYLLNAKYREHYFNFNTCQWEKFIW